MGGHPKVVMLGPSFWIADSPLGKWVANPPYWWIPAEGEWADMPTGLYDKSFAFIRKSAPVLDWVDKTGEELHLTPIMRPDARKLNEADYNTLFNDPAVAGGTYDDIREKYPEIYKRMLAPRPSRFTVFNYDIATLESVRRFVVGKDARYYRGIDGHRIIAQRDGRTIGAIGVIVPNAPDKCDLCDADSVESSYDINIGDTTRRCAEHIDVSGASESPVKKDAMCPYCQKEYPADIDEKLTHYVGQCV